MGSPRITLVAHTHWDREWYQPFETFRAQLVETLDEALELLERDSRLTFTLDGHVALVDDYLEMRPQAEPRIRALNAAGRLHIGPWYTQADTLLVDGESLIRNLAFGIRRAEELGGAMRLGYMADQFGHAAQLPQLLRSFGIEGAVMWRGIGPERPPHAFRWLGPDGSAVTALWLQDGYATGRRLPSDPQGFAQAVERTLDRLASWLGEIPLVIPVGDDHVRLASWLPAAADALQKRRPDLMVSMGGYQDHLPHVGAAEHVVRGELRSPAFAPVLAGVASARIREKQQAAYATVMLQRYAEPLAAWAALAGESAPRSSVERAWKQLLLNQAHDSVAGCGIDAAHDDVKSRYRWAAQLAEAARDQALASLRADTADVTAFHPGPRAEALTVEAHLPRSLFDAGALVAVGPDGVERPIQALGATDERPLFEGEFAANELAQYLGGLDPATPIFGKYLTGITARPDGPGRIRLDVGLGETAAPPNALAADQVRVQAMLAEAERFKVVLHGAGTSRPALVQAGGAAEAALVPIAVRAGTPSASFVPATAVDGAVAIACGPLSVTAEPDGTVTIRDPRSGLGPVRANDLVDEGDRGDLYHFDPTQTAPVRARAARARVTESGPLRARLIVEQDFDLPAGLSADRRARSESTRPTTVTTEITLTAGERRVEFVTTFDNQVLDHRLRALTHVPIHAERLDVDHGLAVVARPFDPASLGSGSERPAPTGQHHHFADVSDGAAGCALMSRGLPEHEVVREAGGRATIVALTLVRGVGWLSRGDLSCIDHAAGPMVPTPGAQELGGHRFEYALVLHRGDWEQAQVHADARRFAAPAIAVTTRGRGAVPGGRSLVEVAPAQVVLSAAHPPSSGRGLVVRVLNASSRAVEATLRAGFEPRECVEVDPLERPLAPSARRANAVLREDTVTLPLGAWQLATILLR
ncbi:MAG TPA: glycoside hydrolase family 38 C-terminal domain-containing protein [Polyangia bacterium]|nr:glycoside hydrolase family 38 C-terminal domain-containing protein [Polyangia bacterium]